MSRSLATTRKSWQTIWCTLRPKKGLLLEGKTADSQMWKQLVWHNYWRWSCQTNCFVIVYHSCVPIHKTKRSLSRLTNPITPTDVIIAEIRLSYFHNFFIIIFGSIDICVSTTSKHISFPLLIRTHWTHMYRYIRMYVSWCTCTYSVWYVYTCTHMCTCSYLCCICMYICVQIYIYICTHMCTLTHIREPSIPINKKIGLTCREKRQEHITKSHANKSKCLNKNMKTRVSTYLVSHTTHFSPPRQVAILHHLHDFESVARDVLSRSSNE